jgi:hypothetical protein
LCRGYWRGAPEQLFFPGIAGRVFHRHLKNNRATIHEQIKCRAKPFNASEKWRVASCPLKIEGRMLKRFGRKGLLGWQTQFCVPVDNL